MKGFEVDPHALESIANTFHNASTDLDALGKSVPGTPDAGDGTAAVTGILSHLVENASSLVLGMAGASDDVTEVNKTYEEQDAAASAELQKASGR